MGCVDKQWRSLLADAAVKDVHVIPTEQREEGERVKERCGEGGKDSRKKRKKETKESKGKKEQQKKRGERVKTGVVLRKVRLIVSAQICWPFQN